MGNECERIIGKGIVDISFFQNAEYFEKRKIQLIMLDLMYEFDSFCKRHQLEYFLVFGSLLGAVRHDGFIPWDDDIDVVMPRESFLKLEKYKNDFSYPYFLQLPLKDDGYYYAVARLRNSNTSALDYPFIYQNFNMGIFLDINVLDNYNIKNGEKKYQMVDELIVNNSTCMKMGHQFLSERDDVRVKEYKGESPEENYNKILQLQQEDNADEDCEHVWISSGTVYGFERNIFNKADFSSFILKSFEGLELRIPSGYKNILTTMYGDYMRLPPREQRNIGHGNIRFDVFKNYKEALEEVFPEGKEGKICWKK